MTIYGPDISGFQAGIDLKGALFAAIKVTEGTTFVNSDWRRARDNATAHGTFAYGYHFLHHGNGAAQARAYRAQTTMPCAVDVERSADNPTVADLCDFTDELRNLGGRVHLAYLPHWYWQAIGSPDLGPVRHRNLFLWSSAYTSYTDGDSGTGWQPYGGSSPAVWQYTDALHFNGHVVDFSAYRGRFAGKQDAASVAACLADFRAMVETGRTGDTPHAANPVTGLHVTDRGFTSLTWAWDAEKLASSYSVKVYAVRDGSLVHQATVTTPSYRAGRLRRKRTYEVHVRAHPGASQGLNATDKATTK